MFGRTKGGTTGKDKDDQSKVLAEKDATIESLRGELEKAKRLIEILKAEVKSLRERDQAFTSIIPELPIKQRMEASAMQLSSIGSSGSLPASSPKLTHNNKNRPVKPESGTSSPPSQSLESQELLASSESTDLKKESSKSQSGIDKITAVGGVNMLGTGFNPADQLAQMKKRNRSATTTTAIISQPVSQDFGASPNYSSDNVTSSESATYEKLDAFSPKQPSGKSSPASPSAVISPTTRPSPLRNAMSERGPSSAAQVKEIPLNLKMEATRQRGGAFQEITEIKAHAGPFGPFASVKMPEPGEAKPIVPSKSTRPRALTNTKRASQDGAIRAAASVSSQTADPNEAAIAAQVPARLSPAASEEKLSKFDKVIIKKSGSSKCILNDFREKKSSEESKTGAGSELDDGQHVALVLKKIGSKNGLHSRQSSAEELQNNVAPVLQKLGSKNRLHSRQSSAEELQDDPNITPAVIKVIAMARSREGSSVKTAPDLKSPERKSPSRTSSAIVDDTPPLIALSTRPSATVAPSIPRSPLIHPPEENIGEKLADKTTPARRVSVSRSMSASARPSVSLPAPSFPQSPPILQQESAEGEAASDNPRKTSSSRAVPHLPHSKQESKGGEGETGTSNFRTSARPSVSHPAPHLLHSKQESKGGEAETDTRTSARSSVSHSAHLPPAIE